MDVSPSTQQGRSTHVWRDFDDLIFIHHSCGANWLSNSLHDALLAKEYIDERNDIYYGTDLSPDPTRPDSLAPTPGDKTNMNHWILWFNDYLEGVKLYGCANGINRIIMFKSCYPISNIEGNGTEPGDPFSGTQTLANYKSVYRHPDGPGHTYTYNGHIYHPLEDIFAAHPTTLFIPVTAPPRHYAPTDATTDNEAHRARLFNNWLKYDWLTNYTLNNPGLGNVAVFDWFDVLSYPDDHPNHPNRLRAEYGGESGNSHPNSLANSDSTQIFATNPTNFIDTSWNIFTQDLTNFTISLYNGWNLITLPLETTWTAESLGKNISGCNLVLRFNACTQSFETYVVGSGYDDFSIVEGVGYFVRVSNETVFSSLGLLLSSVNVTIHDDWNTLGWFHEYPSSAQSLGENTGASLVLAFNVTTQDFMTYVMNSGYENFIISRGMGVFIQASTSGWWHGEG
jgi:hypothetical protein